MWDLNPQDGYLRRLRQWPKKHKRELAAVLNNLDTFQKALRQGQRPGQARFGFIHPEPGGVLAIDQKGGGPGLSEARLYIFPDEVQQCLFLITIGDKNTQHQQDIDTCREFVSWLRSVRKGETTNNASQ
jgi:hypothetical protein